jgi:restriction endonuclease S subunit
MTAWPVKTLGDVCELSTGGTPSTGNKIYYDGGQIKWLRSGDVHQREIYDCDGRITEEGMRNANTRFLPLNSVLIALAGQGKTRGTVAMLRTKATCNQSVVSIAPVDTKKLLPEFIYWNLHMKYDEIRRMTGDDGNDRRGLNMRLIRSMTVPIAPLEEQKRIVALLDAATTRVTELTECYEQARTHANNFFTSALHETLASNPDWPIKTLGEVALVNPSEPALSEDAPFVPMDAVTSGKRDVQYTQPRGQRSGARARAGDILFARITPCLQNGKVALVQDEITRCGGSTEFIVVRAGSEVLNGFLYQWITSDHIRDEVTALMKGATGRQRLNAEDLAQTELPVPPLEEQKRIVARLEVMKAKTSEIVAAYDAKLAEAKNLRQSILEAAFGGDL